MRTLRHWTERFVVLSMLVWAAAGFAAPVAAQTPQQEPAAEQEESAAESRAAAFRAVEGAQQEDVPGGALLIGAYGVAWVLLLLFVVRLGKLQARTTRDIGRLEKTLAGLDDPAAPSSGGPRDEEARARAAG